MAIVRPFRGFRPNQDIVAQVAALPYDVMDSEEARKITQQNPNSFLRVTKSEVDLAPEVDSHSPAVYEKARENLNAFIEQQILRQDAKPCFYIYRQQMGAHVQIGLVATVSVDEYEQNIVKKHEFTRPDKELDRVNHITVTRAQTGSVFLTYKQDNTIDELISQAMKQQPVYDFVSDDGIGHALYIVEDDAVITAIQTAFAGVDILYIADGHHRSAAAARVRDAFARQNPQHTGEEEYNFFQTVIFPHNMMQIMDYNRVVQDLNGLSIQQLFAKIEDKFEVEALEDSAAKPTSAHTFGMYVDNGWYRLTAKKGTYDDSNPVERLDVSILQNNLLTPVLGIGNPRVDKRINFIGGIRGMKELENLVKQGKYAVAFSLFPTSIEELMTIADAGEVMPPKSTWFEPKLRDAMVVNCLPS